MYTSKVCTDDSRLLQESNFSRKAATGHITSYRYLLVKKLPKVPTWQLEVKSYQRPSVPKAATTATQPTTPLRYVGILAGWLIYYLFYYLIDWLIDWLTDWLTDWLIDWLIDWLVGWLVDWLIDWYIHINILYTCLLDYMHTFVNAY